MKEESLKSNSLEKVFEKVSNYYVSGYIENTGDSKNGVSFETMQYSNHHTINGKKISHGLKNSWIATDK